MAQVRTRFAPSPTGYLHIGGARTALFNFLFARHNGGKFILRIEDTDRERSTPEAIKAILDAMSWLGLDWDEGPFYQTERYPLYQEKIQQLLAEGKAYPCICTSLELDAKRQQAQKEKRKPMYDGTCRPPEGVIPSLPKDKPFTVRFRSPHGGSTIVEDAVKGQVVFDNRELDDLIIARSDGTPTYNFCVVVDDIEMDITHIIRGDDHLANTPRQILLYQALKHTPPRFAHVPLILGTDKARLSKRHGATSVMAYRDMGYFPEAVLNYLVRGVFNPEKFLWVNSHYLKERPLSQLAEDVTPYIVAKGYPVPQDKSWLEKMVKTLRERSKTLVELVDSAGFYLTDDISIDEKAATKFLTPEVRAPIAKLIEKLTVLDDFTEANIEQVFSTVLEDLGLSMGQLAQPVRVALTGSTVSPGIHEVIAVLGKERTLRRLRSALQRLQP